MPSAFLTRSSCSFFLASLSLFPSPPLKLGMIQVFVAAALALFAAMAIMFYERFLVLKGQ
ncbi:MAG: hypothetical protein PHH79_05445 [Aminobacterium colombiense]|nr:hypothetical protein [Aminobacterium colombiense]